MSHLLCVFLDSRDHEKLPVDHPFYDFVKVTLQHVVESPLVLRYMAQNTLQNEPLPDEVMGEQRVQEIIQYLKINCPTVSGSDSATMYPKTLVATRAYLGCGQDPKNRKLARKHVYFQKSLIDGWMKLRSDPNSSRGHFFLLTFLMKLCLLRGLIVAVKIAFMSEDIDAKNLTHGPPRPVHHSSSSFECLLCEWNVWLRLRYFWSYEARGNKYIYDPDGIIFSVGLRHVRVSASLCDLQNKRTLLRLYVGDWTALPPLQDVPFMALAEENAGVEQIWNSPPAEDQNPREIEMTQKESDEDNSSGCCVV